MNEEQPTDAAYKALCEWKKRYTEAIIEELAPTGDVLEVGFGIGHAARKIQTYHPKSHTILERDPIVAQEAKHWAAKRSKVYVVEGDWSEVLHKLGKYDTIFYNGYPIVNQVEMLKRQSKEQAASTANKAKQLLQSIDDQLSKLSVSFSDEQIDDFYQTIGKVQAHELPKFFTTLKKYGYITDKQFKRAMDKYAAKQLKEEALVQPPGENQRLIDFVHECLLRHTRKGSRISSYLISPVSLYEDAAFFDSVITNPNLDYQEKAITIEVAGCDFKEAMLISMHRLA